MNHELTRCHERAHSAHFHTKSWSYAFECPVCHKSTRANTNFLGKRRIYCDGQRSFRFTNQELEAALKKGK